MDHGYHHSKKSDMALVICLSLFFHLIIISAALFIPFELSPRHPKGYTFYEVNLVELPQRKIGGKKAKNISHRKRMQIVPKKEKAIVIPKKRIRVRKRRAPNRIIEKAIARIRKRVKRRHKDYIEQAISRIEKRIAKEEKPSPSSSPGAVEGLSLRLYKVQIRSRIESNWIYPAALISPRKKDLEAIMILRVKKNGEIMKFWFKKKSNDAIFNQSLIKAIERSNPLPPFPEGYNKRYEEIEIHFSLSELMGS